MKTTRKLLGLLLAVLLSAAAFVPAIAQEAEQESAAYLVVGSQYALNETGQATLYSDDGTPIGTVANGARLTVTNGQREGRTFVRFGAVTGWIATADLSDEMPETAPAPSLEPIRTEPPANEEQEVPEAESAPDGSAGPIEQPEEIGGEVDEEADTTEQLPGADADDSTAELLPGADADRDDSNETYSDLTGSQPAPDDTATDPETTAEGIDHPDLHDPIPAMFEAENGEPEAVNVVRLGVVYSLLDTDEGIKEAETALLTFAEEIPEEKKLGYVHAPRTGQAGLREEASKSSKVLTQLKAGQIVAVLALEEDFAHVNVQGREGWLRLDCLRYFQTDESGAVGEEGNLPTEAEKPEATEQPTEETKGADVLVAVEGQPKEQESYPRQAVLTCQGEADGETSVNLRNAPTKDSAKTAVWRTGEEVTVLSGKNGWYLAEARGVCGYVMEAFLSFE